MTTAAPDIFSNVHKGIRMALFEVSTALGRAGDDALRSATARARLREAIHFVTHHGENEDLLLLPLLGSSAPSLSARMQAGHAEVNDELRKLQAIIDVAPTRELYHRTCRFTALYLEHMREEEQELEPQIRVLLSFEQLADFGRRCVERTTPEDRRTMLGWMLPAMTSPDVEAFLARLPAEEAEPLRMLAHA